MALRKGSTTKHTLIILTICLALIPMSTITYAATAGQIEDVAKEFVCNCGCNKLLPACDMSCGINLKKKIGEKVNAGWSKPKIMNFMKKNYGSQLLAAPEAKGSGLTAWITPFAALIVGAVTLYFIITSWAKGKEAEPATAGEAATIDTKDKKTKKESKTEVDEYKKKMDEELKDFDW